MNSFFPSSEQGYRDYLQAQKEQSTQKLLMFVGIIALILVAIVGDLLFELLAPPEVAGVMFVLWPLLTLLLGAGCMYVLRHVRTITNVNRQQQALDASVRRLPLPTYSLHTYRPVSTLPTFSQEAETAEVEVEETDDDAYPATVYLLPAPSAPSAPAPILVSVPVERVTGTLVPTE